MYGHNENDNAKRSTKEMARGERNRYLSIGQSTKRFLRIPCIICDTISAQSNHNISHSLFLFMQARGTHTVTVSNSILFYCLISSSYKLKERYRIHSVFYHRYHKGGYDNEKHCTLIRENCVCADCEQMRHADFIVQKRLNQCW
jgi:hypothetical protein